MEINKKDILYNLDYVVCIPNYDRELKEAFEYSFENTYFLEDNVEDTAEFLNFIKRNNIKSIIFVNFLIEYLNIIKSISSSIEIKFIYTKQLAYMSNEQSSLIFNNIMDLYNKNVFEKIGIIDRNLYVALKNANMQVYRIILDIEKKEKKLKTRQNNIGLLNNDFDPNHSYYNELSAIKLTKKTFVANLYNPLKETIDFAKVFNIPYKCYKLKEEMYNSEINLYVNFTNTNDLEFLISMDCGIPCIMGNTNLLDNYKDLKNLLVIKSDDDIDEIALKIDNAIENKTRIIKEYEMFRKEYSQKSQKLIEDFIQYKKDNNEFKKDKEEILLSVIVPVYNTVNYIEECLESIEKAKINNMETIVINDGSSDNSEEIIRNYIEKHKSNIIYIKQDNHGLGNVRNVGLKNAKGKYIASVDSDDTINKNYFKEAEKYLNTDIDMVICDWMSIYSNGDKFETCAKDYIFNDMNDYKGILFTTIMPSTCNKIIKKSIIDNLGYKYAEGLKYEDLSLNPLLLLKLKTIKYINKPYYEYKIRENSIMRTGAGYNMIDVIKMIDDRVNEKFNKKNCSIDLEEFKYYTYFWRTEEFIFNQLYDLKSEEREKFIQYFKQKLNSLLKELYNNKYYIERINALDKSIKKYLNARNKELFDGDLDKFIEKAIKERTYKKLTPPLIFYGRSN